MSSCELGWNGPSFLQLIEDKWPALEGSNETISKGKSAKKVQDNTVCPTPDEVNLAEVIWVHTIQAKSFDREIQYLSKPTLEKPIRVDQFKLFIDKDNMLRNQGRI